MCYSIMTGLLYSLRELDSEGLVRASGFPGDNGFKVQRHPADVLCYVLQVLIFEQAKRNVNRYYHFVRGSLELPQTQLLQH